jgi:hypothetical protein
MAEEIEKFNYFIPIDLDLEKAGEQKEGKIDYDKMYVKGVCSDDSQDTDEEILDPAGYDLSRFLTYGFLNYEHQTSKSPKAIVGEPTKAMIKGNQMHLEGKLYKDSVIARDLYDTALMLKKSGSNRHIGFSIEGKALERDSVNKKRVTKALITNCAITFTPKNTNTFMDIVKGNTDELYKTYDWDLEKGSANGGEQYIIDVTDPKSGMRYIVKKDFSIKVEKAMSTENSGQVAKEDLEGTVKPQNDYVSEDIKKSIVIVAAAHKQGMLSQEQLQKFRDKLK